ncbi:MAG: hypothetical protein FJ150_09015 [Euryarchaeota archaeon]|nr:hypothetical protein [Euryarchaeota archaeon]
MYNFEELDEITRKWMLEEFQDEEKSGNPYRSSRLSSIGLKVFPNEMEKAIKEGNEKTLALALYDPKYWKTSETYPRGNKIHTRKINPIKAAEFLAYTEFNTWYVRGFARRLLEEGEEFCQVYRAAPAWKPRAECLTHENQIYKVKKIYEGHRARYWPKPGDETAFCIPVGTNCHHSIKRVK